MRCGGVGTGRGGGYRRLFQPSASSMAWVDSAWSSLTSSRRRRELSNQGRSAGALADPAQVRAMQDGWVGPAAAARFAASGAPGDDVAGQGVVDLGQFR